MNEKYNKAKEKGLDLVSFNYIFAGIGQYVACIPRKCFNETGMKERFRVWIDGNGSAFAGDPETASEEDIKMWLVNRGGVILW